MNPDHRALLGEKLGLFKRVEEALRYSYGRCLEVGQKNQYTHEELERFESLTSRFSRMSDLLLQRVVLLLWILYNFQSKFMIRVFPFLPKIYPDLKESQNDGSNTRSLSALW